MALKLALVSSFIGSLVTAAPSTNGDLQRRADPSRYLFVFGDSYTATGFQNNGTLPTTSNPFGNPPYPGSIDGVYPNTTYSGGENWIDYLVKDHIPAGAVVYNLAVGGNPVNYTQVQGAAADNDGKVHDLLDQMTKLKDLLVTRNVAPKRTSTNSLFLLWFGINDLNIAYNLIVQNAQPNRNADQVIAKDVNQYFAQLDVLYKTYKARNILTILVPPISRSPIYGGDANKSAYVANLTSHWASLINSGNSAFKSSHSGVKSIIFDPTNSFNKVLDNYAAYGAPNNTCYSCCGGNPKCLWHDFIHASPPEHQQMASDLYPQLQNAGFV